MALRIAEMLGKLKIDQDFRKDIAHALFRIGNELKEGNDFSSAGSYFELAAKKYQQCDDEQDWLGCLVLIAECFEQEADARSEGSSMAANTLYENAIQACRHIPAKHRDAYKVNNKIKASSEKFVGSFRE